MMNQREEALMAQQRAQAADANARSAQSAYQGRSTSSEVESLRAEIADLKKALAPLVKAHEERLAVEQLGKLMEAAERFDAANPLTEEERAKFAAYVFRLRQFNTAVIECGFEPDDHAVVQSGAFAAVGRLHRKDGGR